MCRPHSTRMDRKSATSSAHRPGETESLVGMVGKSEPTARNGVHATAGAYCVTALLTLLYQLVFYIFHARLSRISAYLWTAEKIVVELFQNWYRAFILLKCRRNCPLQIPFLYPKVTQQPFDCIHMDNWVVFLMVRLSFSFLSKTAETWTDSWTGDFSNSTIFSKLWKSRLRRSVSRIRAES